MLAVVARCCSMHSISGRPMSSSSRCGTGHSIAAALPQKGPGRYPQRLSIHPATAGRRVVSASRLGPRLHRLPVSGFYQCNSIFARRYVSTHRAGQALDDGRSWYFVYHHRAGGITGSRHSQLKEISGRTSVFALRTSAFGGKADMTFFNANFCF